MKYWMNIDEKLIVHLGPEPQKNQAGSSQLPSIVSLTQQDKENDKTNTVQSLFSLYTCFDSYMITELNNENYHGLLKNCDTHFYTEQRSFGNTPLKVKQLNSTVHLFTVSEIRRLDCQFGRHYFKEKPAQSNRTLLQGTRKIGCLAHITVKTLTLFPEYAVENPSLLSPRKLKEMKKKQLDKLH